MKIYKGLGKVCLQSQSHRLLNTLEITINFKCLRPQNIQIIPVPKLLHEKHLSFKGKARCKQGKETLGMARKGPCKASQGKVKSKQGKATLGMAKARQCMARQSKTQSRQGNTLPYMDLSLPCARKGPCKARQGKERQGKARQGNGWQGKVRPKQGKATH